MEIVVLSGKGGTGKTSVASCFAALADRPMLADTDVDAANLSLVLGAQLTEEEEFVGGNVAVRDPDSCSECGLCREHCRFGAISDSLELDPRACEGCALCSRLCPEGAISMEPRLSGHLRVSSTPWGTLVGARLIPGEENSGKLAFRVKEVARERAAAEGAPLLIVDGPPGVGCPVIATLSGADLALVVTEVGLAGAHDLARILDLAEHFSVPAGVVINKWDLAPESACAIRDECERRGAPVVGFVPFDPTVVRAIVAGHPPVAWSDGAASRALRAVWREVRKLVFQEEPACLR